MGIGYRSIWTNMLVIRPAEGCCFRT